MRNDRASMHYGKVFSKGYQFDEDWQNYRYFLYIALFFTKVVGPGSKVVGPWSKVVGPWSKVVHYIVDRVQFGTQCGCESPCYFPRLEARPELLTWPLAENLDVT